MSREEWRQTAACRSIDPAVFFPLTLDGTAAAKAHCRSCPVAEQCLEFALSTGQDHGIWGGLDEDERRRLRRRRQARPRWEPSERVCPQCGGPFMPRAESQIYHARSCADEANRAAYRRRRASLVG